MPTRRVHATLGSVLGLETRAPDYNRRSTSRNVLRKFWLLFAQACTLCVAALFVVATLRPDLLPRLAGKNNRVVLLQQAGGTIAAPGVTSYAEAARKAMPA